MVKLWKPVRSDSMQVPYMKLVLYRKLNLTRTKEVSMKQQAVQHVENKEDIVASAAVIKDVLIYIHYQATQSNYSHTAVAIEKACTLLEEEKHSKLSVSAA